MSAERRASISAKVSRDITEGLVHKTTSLIILLLRFIGMIASKFYNWCDGESLSKHKLEEGKDKCRRTVNRLLDWKLRH